MARRRKAHTPRLPRIPMMPELRNQFGLQMHTALHCLGTNPNDDSFNALAEVFNVVQIAISEDKKRQHEARLINGGASALNQVMARVQDRQKLHDYELAPVRVAVNTIDLIMGKIDVTTLYEAMQRLKQLKAEEAMNREQ